MIEIRFSTDELFPKIMMTNQLRAMEIITKEGQPKFDNYSITEDEKEYIETFLSDIAAEMGDIASGVLDTVYTTSPFGVTIKDKEMYNTENIKILKKQFEDFMIKSVLYKWYLIKGLFDEYKLALQEATIMRDAIVKTLFFFEIRSMS